MAAASVAGVVREDEAFRCFADAFANLELHLARSIADPQEDTNYLLVEAEKRSGALEPHMQRLSSGAEVAEGSWADEKDYVEDADIPPPIREVFIEESEEIVAELQTLLAHWMKEPQANGVLRDIRRHFHTFKGNGRAVGANVLGELGWAAQDMLDHVLDGDLEVDNTLQTLLKDVIATLPDLVMSYRSDLGLNLNLTRELTNRCFRLAGGGTRDSVSPVHAAQAGATQTLNMAAGAPVSELAGH